MRRQALEVPKQALAFPERRPEQAHPRSVAKVKDHGRDPSQRDTREFGKRLLRENLASEKDLLNDPVTNPNLDDGGCENGERQEEPDYCRTSNGRNQVCGIQCPMARGCNQEQSEHNDAETSADDADAS